MNEKTVSWIYVFIAGLTEIVWAIAMDYSDGFTKIEYGIIVVAFLALGMVFLTKALSSGLPMGTVYSVWVGIGAVGTMAFSVILGLETVTPLRGVFVSLVIVGILGLKFLSDDKSED